MTCTTHHRACECREREHERLRELVARMEAAISLLECELFDSNSCRNKLPSDEWCNSCHALAPLEETR